MTLSSMTGFARSHGAHGGWRWHWEVRSVNARGLDVRLRLPEGFEALEQPSRLLASERFSRGNISASLTLDLDPGRGGIRVNREVLEQVLGVLNQLERQVRAAPATLDGILGLRGVMEVQPVEFTEAELAERDAALLTSLASALDALLAARRDEGARLASVLRQQASRLSGLVRDAENLAAGVQEASRTRLRSAVEQLLAGHSALSEERLSQEVAILLVKGDVREEIDRLKSHLQQADELFAGKGSQGRRLDFLSQELNREANTLCSKSSDIQLTRVGLEMKAVIDQMREQVQNVE